MYGRRERVDGDPMREWGGELDRVQTDSGCCPVMVGGWHRVGCARFAVLVGSMLACVASLLWGLGPVGIPAASAESCPNAASRQGPSINLPECRVYEQVTPVDKGDAIDIFGSSPYVGTGTYVVDPGNKAYVAEDGDAILVKTDGSFAADATDSASAYVFSRGAEGWHMGVMAQSIDEPQKVEEAKLFDPHDLSAVGFVDELGTYNQLLSGDASAFQHALLVGPVGGPYAPLYSVSGFAALNEEDTVEMVGGSEDLSHVILEGENHSLAQGADEQDRETDALYEATGAGECGPATSNCRLVDMSPEGKPMPCGATLGQGELGAGGAHSAVSADGSRIFFTAPEPGKSGVGCWNNPKTSPQESPPKAQENPPEVYMREGGARTVEISVPLPGSGVKVGGENPLLPAVFVGASADGSKVFFMTKTDLTKGAVGHTPELYKYNTEPGQKEKALTLISGGPSEALEGDVDNVTAVSSDGSAVYFSAYGDLATGASQYPSPPNEATFSHVNLYRYDTTTGVTTFITTLNKRDYPAGLGEGLSWYSPEFGEYGAENEGLSVEKEWYTTGDGRFLLFGTVLPLTGFDNTHAPGVTCPSNYIGGQNPERERCFELYRYDAATNQIVCVSCAGGAPVDSAYFARTSFVAPASGPPRPISEDGEDVFFDSASALVPQAIPGRVHVYEWHGGVVSLISSPSDPGSAFFLGSSADGSNVFVVTHAQLSAQDTDQSADVYDARVGGGFAGLTASQCTGTGCQGVPGAPPIFATPASVTFEGVGNFTAAEPPGEPGVKPRPTGKAKCGRGRVKKHGKCIIHKVGKSSKKGGGK